MSSQVFLTDTLTADDITIEKKYPGVRINIIATLGTYRQKLTMDIGFGDVICPYPTMLEYPTLFNSMEEPLVSAYSLETVVAEKFQTMIDRGRFNSRMKDFFDLYRILRANRFDTEMLAKAIKETFGNRETRFTDNHDFFNKNFGTDAKINQQWDNYQRRIKSNLPKFSEIHTFITKQLLPYWSLLK